MQKNWTEIDNAYKQLGFAQKSIEQSQENLKLNTDMYHAGTTKMSDLMDAQSQYQQARDKYVDAYAMLETKIDLNPEYHTFQFYTQATGDTLFAVKRADGLYWGNTVNWVSPYNKIATSTTPQYIFVLDNRTLTSVNSILNNAEAKQVSVKYYTIDGRLTNVRQKGILIKCITFADGSMKSSKIVVR